MMSNKLTIVLLIIIISCLQYNNDKLLKTLEVDNFRNTFFIILDVRANYSNFDALLHDEKNCFIP